MSCERVIYEAVCELCGEPARWVSQMSSVAYPHGGTTTVGRSTCECPCDGAQQDAA